MIARGRGGRRVVQSAGRGSGRRLECLEREEGMGGFFSLDWCIQDRMVGVCVGWEKLPQSRNSRRFRSPDTSLHILQSYIHMPPFKTILNHVMSWHQESLIVRIKCMNYLGISNFPVIGQWNTYMHFGWEIRTADAGCGKMARQHRHRWCFRVGERSRCTALILF